MKSKNIKMEKRMRLKKKIRAKINGTDAIPRLSVFRSNTFISAQLIDDLSGKTLAQASDMKLKKGTKGERAKEVGKMIAEAAKTKNISKVVFDRNGFKFTGRIAALAEEARSAGLKF